jgi:phosphatidylserine decarboxylase
MQKYLESSTSECRAARSSNTRSLNEIEETDLHNFPNLAAFFYRTLRPGVRPIDPNPNAVVSPADGKIIQFGAIINGEVEQVKGMTYSLEALLGSHTPSPSSSGTSTPTTSSSDEESILADEEFAKMNGISYTLPSFLGTTKGAPTPTTLSIDQSTEAKPLSETIVRDTLSHPRQSWWPGPAPRPDTALYYCVVYLAPGDYHRLHSPAAWVVERRRHFAGELYSVSPWLQRTLPGLFTLNERVVLLGRWRWGFFSATPVGATNVGSIVVNFDRELRTNSLLTDTAADRAAARASEEGGGEWGGFAEASYERASALLGGHPLRRGEEFGGFRLGSTVVLVFEAPRTRRAGGERSVGWRWGVEMGQAIKVGQALGEVVEKA